MQDLESLAIIWLAVFAAHYLAGRTRLTPVLWFLAMGCLLVNVGILPEEPGIFLVDLSEVGIIVIMFALGFGMLGRAELAFVVMDIAFVQHSIINEEMFYTLMFTAFGLNLLVPITIRQWKPRMMAIDTQTAGE